MTGRYAPGAEPTRSDDEAMLCALDQLDGGATYRMAGLVVGMSRGGIMDHVRRIRAASDRHGCACTKAENRDGGMPSGWWRGLGDNLN